MSTIKASPAELRKAIAISNALKEAGVDFVPVIVESEEHKKALVAQMMQRLEEMERQAV